MNRFDEPTSPAGGSEPTREKLVAKILRLEAENTKMRADADQWEHDRDALAWYRFEGLPASETEFLEKMGPSINDVIAECEQVLLNEQG